MLRKAKVDKDTWEDFIVDVTSRAGTWPCCGLCGNTGVLAISGRLTPAGISVPPVRGHCICPNGRATKFIDDKLKKDP
jgi:hypothetical protein